jgi:hypothetical protein
MLHEHGVKESLIQVLQIAQDRLRVRDAFAAPLDRSARPEQLRLGNHRDGRSSECQAGKVGRHGEREARRAGCEGVPALDDAHLVLVRPQHLVQHLAPAGGVGGEQYAPLERPQERIERALIEIQGELEQRLEEFRRHGKPG